MSAQNKNEGKPKWALLFKDMPNAMLGLCRVREKGCVKYSRMNWSESIGKPEAPKFKEENLESIIRHCEELLKGNEIDEDGEHHGSHIMCRGAFAVEYYSPENKEDEFIEYYKTLEKKEGLDYFVISKEGRVFATKCEVSELYHGDWYFNHKTWHYEHKAPEHLQDQWKTSLRKLEYIKDPAWEIDQLVTWPYPRLNYFYFDRYGNIFYGINAPKIDKDAWVHADGYSTTIKIAPHHLTKYWRESVRTRP
jgi:hypothetical protein